MDKSERQDLFSKLHEKKWNENYMKNYTETIMCLFRSTKHTRNYLLFPDKKIRRGYQLDRQNVHNIVNSTDDSGCYKQVTIYAAIVLASKSAA